VLVFPAQEAREKRKSPSSIDTARHWRYGLPFTVHEMELLLARPVVIGLAILGAVASTLAMVLQAHGTIGKARAKQLNGFGYACMGVSMLLFIIAGFRG